MRKYTIIAVGALVAAAAGAAMQIHGAQAADHMDSMQATNDPAADLADVYAWMNEDASKLNLVMTLAGTGQFSDAVDYVFHVSAGDGPLEPGAEVETPIRCTFDPAGMTTCAVGDAGPQVTGDASNASDPLVDDETTPTIQVFAGLRDDPFFFNLSGFGAVVSAVNDAVAAAPPPFTVDGDGCPTFNDDAVRASLVTQLSTEPGGGAAIDDFDGANVLALVVQVDKELIGADDETAPLLGVWASTERN